MNEAARKFFDPYSQNSRLKKINTKSRQFSRKELQDMLGNPSDSEEKLRAASWRFYNTITQIMKETHLYADILSYRWWLLPKTFNGGIKTEYEKADAFIRGFDPKKQFNQVVLEVMREGKVAYAIRQEAGTMFLQKLPSDYWKIVYNTDRGWKIAFNFMYFVTEGADVSLFSEFFQETYAELTGVYDINKNKMVKEPPKGVQIQKYYNKYSYWVEVPVNEARVFSFDDTRADVLPPLMSQFINANDLDSYKQLQQQLLEIPLNQIMTATVPLQKNNKSGSYMDDTAITPQLCVLYENSIRQSLPDNVDFVAAPFENFKLFGFENVQNRDNIVGDSITNFYNEAVGGLINTSDKPSVKAIDSQQKIETAFISGIYRQFMQFINYRLLIQGFKNMDFRIDGDIFSDEKRFELVKKAIDSGNYNMYPEYLSFFDQSLVSADSTMSLVDSFGIYDKLKVPPTSFTASSDTAGRPSVDIEDASDGTIASIESGINTAEGRLT